MKEFFILFAFIILFWIFAKFGVILTILLLLGVVALVVFAKKG
ncbi:MAG: hypothetical protein P1P64_03300 [Treponemataceae bacterium]